MGKNLHAGLTPSARRIVGTGYGLCLLLMIQTAPSYAEHLPLPVTHPHAIAGDALSQYAAPLSNQMLSQAGQPLLANSVAFNNDTSIILWDESGKVGKSASHIIQHINMEALPLNGMNSLRK